MRGAASKMRAFTLKLIESKPYDDNLSQLLARWIVYFRQKYPFTENLMIELYDGGISQRMVANGALEGSLTKAVAQMSDLKLYNMIFSPITPNALNAMDSIGVKLAETTICGMDENDFTSQLKNLKHSQQNQHIKTLYIECEDDYFEGDQFRLDNTSLNNQFTNLKSICITCRDSSYTELVDILENAPPTLETINFNSILFDQTGEEERGSTKTFHNSRVEELDFVGCSGL